MKAKSGRRTVSARKPRTGGSVRASGSRTLPGKRRRTLGSRGTQRRSNSRTGPGRPERTAADTAAWTKAAARLSVIVSAMNEERTLPRVLEETAKLRAAETIVVLNGCTDTSFERARRCREAVIVHMPEAAGHDVSRAIGARLARGDILLFVDGDIPIPAAKLKPFVRAVADGADVALNDIDPLLPPFRRSDAVTRSKQFLNLALGRDGLGAASMTAVPHAISRRALDTVGAAALMVPPKAQAIAIAEGLRVVSPATVNVIRGNRKRGAGNTGAGNPVAALIAGDHAEALQEAMDRLGRRMLPEGAEERRREVAAWRNGR